MPGRLAYSGLPCAFRSGMLKISKNLEQTGVSPILNVDAIARA
jgi:hypothetical protein